MKIEEKFKNTFVDRIGQVFLYLIDECNLKCIHCLYKSELTFYLNKKSIPYEEAIDLMINFHLLGARKITFMGGEPTLYPHLPDLIHKAKEIGYDYLRIDTNGQFMSELLDNSYFKELSEITFSLDGYDETTNDFIRGNGSFKRCLKNIRKAVLLNYNVHITHCIHSRMAEMVDGKLAIFKVIELCKELGVKKINMHDLLKFGLPRDNWSDNISTSQEEYFKIYKEVLDFKKNEDRIEIRIPQCLISKEDFESNPSYYGYCSVKQFDRVLVFPNGILRICSLLIGTPYCIGYYNKESILWNHNPTNEILSHDMQTNTCCTHQGRGIGCSKYLPLCVSFKPSQNEPIWVSRLKWEEKRNRL